MNSRFHKVLKLKSTSSSEYSRRIHVLATKKTSLRYTDTIHRNSCTYPRHLQPYLDLSPFVLQGWTKGLVIMCLKNSYTTFFFFNSSYKIRGHLMMKKIFYPYNIQLSSIQTLCFQSTGHGYSNFNLGRSALLQMRAAHLWSLINSPTTSGVNSVLEVVKVHSCTQGMMTNSAGWSQWPSLYWDAP